MKVSEALGLIAEGGTLERGAARAVIGDVLRGETDPVQLGALLVLLRQRGETEEELVGGVEALRASMTPFEHDAPGAIDTCGTGGDGLETFNLSTAAALVAAAAGAMVVKHGNRSVSSRCGSADLLEAAGLELDLSPRASREVFEGTGITFLFAPRYHPALRHAAEVRARLGLRTLFNWLGPLASPARVRRQLLGVSSPELVPRFLGVLDGLGHEAALVVHGAGGADELTLGGANTVQAHGPCPSEGLDAEPLGLQVVPACELRGGDAAENLRLLGRVLAGEPGPLLDAVLLNAAAALLVAGSASEAGHALELSRRAIRDGAAQDLLERWIGLSKRAARRAS